MADKHCEFVSREGKRCRAYKITDSQYCFTHSDDPKVIAMREEALKKAAESHKLYFPIKPAENGEVGLNLPQSIDLNNSKAIKKAYRIIFRAATAGALSERWLGALIYALNGYVNSLEKIELMERIERAEIMIKLLRSYLWIQKKE